MRRASRLTRSTPFRLAVTFTILLVAGFLLAGAIVYRIMSLDLADRLDETIQQTWTVIAASYGDNDLEDLTAAIDSHVRLQDDGQQLFSLIMPSGAQLAGNFVPDSAFSGFRDIRHAETAFRAYSGAVGANTLTVAFAYSETRELQMIVLAGFGWATIIVGCLAITAGVLLASGIQRRLDAIAHTMAEVSVGNISARIPLIGNGDDIDAVSAQVNDALDRLVALMEATRQVGHDIAHELKTPLNRLHIVLEQMRADATGKLATGLDEAQDEMARINATFEALLRISQIESGSRRAKFQDLEIGEVLAVIEEIYAEVAADEGKSLTYRRESAPLIVTGDRELLTQLFANLVENALRHCPAGTSIELSATRDANRIVAAVRDDGPGIPPEEREKVFRRLYRMDHSRTTPGSGLGLSLVKAVADLHHAELTAGDAKPGLRVEVAFSAR